MPETSNTDFNRAMRAACSWANEAFTKSLDLVPRALFICVNEAIPYPRGAAESDSPHHDRLERHWGSLSGV
jgi:hypothetical protein